MFYTYICVKVLVGNLFFPVTSNLILLDEAKRGEGYLASRFIYAELNCLQLEEQTFFRINFCPLFGTKICSNCL